MDLAEVKAIFFTAPESPAPPPPAVTLGTPARRLRDAIEPLACQSIWSQEAADRYVELGLDDWFAAYVWQRVAALGTPPTPVAVMALGVFAPELIGPLYERAIAAISHEDVVRVRLTEPGVTVRRLLGDIGEEAGTVLAGLRRGLDAADTTARPLFTGLADEPWPDDVVAALVHACHLLREHRGDSHLAVCAAAGLDPVEMNILTELYCGYRHPSYTVTRGWSDQRIAEGLRRLRGRGLIAGDAGDAALTTEGLRLRTEMETRTDAMQAAIVDAVGPHLESHVKQLDAWSDALVAAGAAPPDPAKRAAG